MTATLTILAGQILRVVMGLLVLRTLSFRLSAAELGLYLAAISLSTVLPRMLDFGIPNTGLYFLRGGEMMVRSYAKLGAIALVLAMLLLLPAVFGLAYIGQFDVVTERFIAANLVALLCVAALEYTTLYVLSASLARSNYVSFSVLTFSTPLFLFGLLGLVFVQGSSFTATIALRAYLSAAALTGAFAVCSILVFALRGPATCEALSWRAFGKYSASSYGSGVMKVVAQRADRLLLIGALSPSAYSQFAIALTLRDALLLPGNAISTHLRNRFMDIQRRVASKNAGLLRSYLQACGFVFVLFLAAAGVFALVPEWLFQYALPASYDDALPIMRLLVFSVAPLGVFAISQSFLYALPALRAIMVVNIFAAASLVLVLFLVGHFGADLYLVDAAIVGWSLLVMAVSLSFCVGTTIHNSYGKDRA